jgi:hypothetical protein
MFRIKRADTLVGTIEHQYRVDLNARSDTLLGNLLEERGFDSLSQLLQAYRGRLTQHPCKRRVFLSFHAEDRAQVQGFRLMARNSRVDLDFYDGSVRDPVNSQNATYIRRVIGDKILQASVLVCLIGNGTAWRDWVDWEIRTAQANGKGLCGVRLKGSYGRTPPALREFGAPVAPWDLPAVIAAIECAAARRS